MVPILVGIESVLSQLMVSNDLGSTPMTSMPVDGGYVNGKWNTSTEQGHLEVFCESECMYSNSDLVPTCVSGY